MIRLTKAQYDGLVEQTVDWLVTALPEDIRQYYDNLPGENKDIIPLMFPGILDVLRERRTTGLRVFFGGNLLSVLPEFEVMRFIGALISYNPDSVITNFKKLYPSLDSVVVEAGVAEWATLFTLLWRNAYYLYTVKAFQDSVLLLNSVLKMNYGREELVRLKMETDSHLESVTKQVESHNYESFFLGQDDQRNLKAYFAELTFFPVEFYESLTEKVELQLLNILQTLSKVFELVRIALEATDVPVPEHTMHMLLWDDIVVNAEYIEFKKTADYWQEEQIPDDAELVKRHDQLQKLFSFQNIENGSAYQYLHSYINSLTAQQKKLFLNDLKIYLTQSVLIGVLFDSVDVEYFITTLQEGNQLGSKSDFINSLEERYLPEEWPLVQKAMLLLASIF